MDTLKNSTTNTLDPSAKRSVQNGERVDLFVVEDYDSERESIVLALPNSIPDVFVAPGGGNEATNFYPCQKAIRE